MGWRDVDRKLCVSECIIVCMAEVWQKIEVWHWCMAITAVFESHCFFQNHHLIPSCKDWRWRSLLISRGKIQKQILAPHEIVFGKHTHVDLFHLRVVSQCQQHIHRIDDSLETEPRDETHSDIVPAFWCSTLHAF